MLRGVVASWQAIDVKVEAQVPLSTSTYVVARVKSELLDSPEIVIDALLEVGVNLNQTPLVVVVVAPPHAPAGPELTAPCKLPPVDEHVTEEVKAVAVLQLA